MEMVVTSLLRFWRHRPFTRYNLQLCRQTMATKTARKKFRPPLKTCRSEQEGPSLPCSQASSTATSGLPGTSQQERVGNAEQDSQSWLSQLTAAAVSTKPKDASSAFNTVSQNYAATAQSKKASSSRSTKASLDDSLSGSERRVEGFASPASDHNSTQTHTMLSYCSESDTVAGNLGAAKRLDKCEVSLDFPESGNSAALDKCSPAAQKFKNAMRRGEKDGNGFLLGLFSVESEEEMMALDEDVTIHHDQLHAPSPSRFQRRNKTTTRRYDYSTMLPKLGAQRTTTKKQKKNSKAKSVRLVVKQSLVSQVSSAAVGCASKDTGQTKQADLSVYDYQPTPQQEDKGQSLAGEREVTFDLNNSNWISRKTREEQVSLCVCGGGGGGGGCSVNIM